MSFTTQATVTIPAASGSTQTNISLVITGNDPKLKTLANGGQVRNTVTRNGQTVPADLILSSDAGGLNLYNWGWDFYDPINGIATIWLLMPSHSSSVSTVIFISLGNAAITTYQGGGVGAEFDGSTLGAWHFPNGSSTLNTKDFSAVGNDGVGTGLVTFGTGKVDGGAFYPLTGVPTVTAPIATTTNYTVSMWASYVDNGSSLNGFYTLTGGANNQNVRSSGNGTNIIIFDNAGAGIGSTPIDLRNGTFHKIDFVYTSTLITLYVDSVSLVTGSGVFGPLAAGNILIGNLFSISGDSWSGVIDEVRFSNIIRSADWIATEYANQSTIPIIGPFSGGIGGSGIGRLTLLGCG